MNKTLINLLMVCLAVACCTGCGGTKQTEKKKCANEQCTCGNNCQGEACTCKKEVTDVTSALLFMDNSASMKGYTADMTYINAITQLWQAYPNTMVLKCGEGYTPLDESKGDVIDQLRALAYTGSSLIHNDLDTMLTRITDSNIAFYITDGILSGEKEDINGRNGDPKWTLKHAAYLKGKIKATFAKAKEMGIGVSIYQFPAQYNGEYYCYDNSHKNINTERYFYVLALGKPGVLLNFKEKYCGTEFFSPEAALHYIDPMPLKVPAKDIYSTDVPSTEKVFSMKSINQKPQNPGMMDISVKTAVLTNNFSAEEIKALATKAVVTVKGEKTDAAPVYDDANQCYRFLIKPQLYGPKFDVTISIPYDLPAWVVNSSQYDEQEGDNYMMKAGEQDNRTFMLNHLVDGIRQGIMGSTGNLLEGSENYTRSED